MKNPIRGSLCPLSICLLALVSVTFNREAGGAPFNDLISFTQPGGQNIRLSGRGDDFYAVFETLDGFTVVFDQALKAYCYASLSADDSRLVSTGVAVPVNAPESLGVPRHLRLSPNAVRRQAQARYARWDAGMKVSTRWPQLRASTTHAPGSQSPPATTTLGTKVGLCLLIDFDDDPATVPQAAIVDFCNSDNYTGYGNNGSVKQYFRDNSNGLLTYLNVVTIYIRIPNSLHPKSWYNDTSQDCGTQGNYLIQDAIQVMKSLPNYTTAILPTFDALTVDSVNQVVALNVFYAGGNGGVWSMGLWPHSWSLYDVGAQELSPGGKKVWRYQISNIGTALQIGTFCHENGHMLCGYPDLYDYGYDSTGGAGYFCIMGYGSTLGANPPQICAYLKRASGWGSTTEMTGSSALLATVSSTGADFNHFYRYQKPGVPTEYYLMECRYRAGHDTRLPASGVAVWHVDELGDRDNQSLVPNNSHLNYELTLVQADGRWDFEHDINSGDAYDLYSSGNAFVSYTNALSDDTKPGAQWWDGTASRMYFHDFSAAASAMTFIVGDTGIAPLIRTQPQSQSVPARTPATLSVDAAGSEPLSYQWRLNGVDIPGETDSSIWLPDLMLDQSGIYSVAVSNKFGVTVSADALLAVVPGSIDVSLESPIHVPEYGLASPYPSTNLVSVSAGSLIKVAVTLEEITHAYPSDLRVLLVGPNGQSAVLMGAAGSYYPITNVTVTFDDAAVAMLPSMSRITDGTYRPSDYRSDTVYSGVNPPYGSTLDVFRGAGPNGNWLLYVLDDAVLDAGSIGGWALHLYAYPGAPVLSAPACDNGSVHLSIQTIAGARYDVQFKNSLNESQWHFLTSIDGDGTAWSVNDAMPGLAQRFYRLQVH